MDYEDELDRMRARKKREGSKKSGERRQGAPGRKKARSAYGKRGQDLL